MQDLLAAYQTNLHFLLQATVEQHNLMEDQGAEVDTIWFLFALPPLEKKFDWDIQLESHIDLVKPAKPIRKEIILLLKKIAILAEYIYEFRGQRTRFKTQQLMWRINQVLKSQLANECQAYSIRAAFSVWAAWMVLLWSKEDKIILECLDLAAALISLLLNSPA